MEAQAVVLDFLRGKIKGAAAEMNTGFTGALSAVAKSMGELMESIGKSFVGDAAKSFMTFLTQSMKDLKNIIDNGNWVEKLRNITLFMWGFRGMDSTPPGNRLSTGRIGGLPEGPKDKTAEQIKKESEVAAAALKERNDLLAIGKANDEKYWEARVANAEQYSEQVNMLARKEIEERKKIEEQNQKGNEEAWTRQWDERVEREAAAGQAFLDQLEKEKKAADQWGKEVGLVFVSAFEDAIVAGKSFRDVLQGIEKDIIRLIVRQQVTQPLGRAFNDAIGSPLGGFFGGLFGGKQSPAPVVDMSFAEGTDYVPRTGLALVHQGEKIIPAAQNNGGGGANITQYINIDSRSDRASILQAMTVAKNAAVAEINNSLRSGGSTAMAAGLV